MKPITLVENRAYISGDSIAVGTYITGTNMNQWFWQETGVDSYNPGDISVGGLQANGWRWIVDYLMTEYSPEVIVGSIGVNNVNTHDSPGLASAQEIAATIITGLEKIANWGAIPIWLGSAPNTNAAEYIAKTEAISEAVGLGCDKHGFIHSDLIATFKGNPGWETDYYDGDGIGVHYDQDGHEVAGKLAASLYPNVAKPGSYKKGLLNSCGDESGWNTGDLQDAMSATKNSTLFVCPGNYSYGDVDDDGKAVLNYSGRRISIIGDSSSYPVLSGEGSGAGILVTGYEPMDTTLKYIEFKDGEEADQGSVRATASGNLIVDSCRFNGGVHSGLKINPTSGNLNATIRNSEFYDSVLFGLHINGSPYVDNVEIDNVTVHDIDDRQSIKFRSGSVEPTAGETVCDSGNTCMTLVSYRKTGGTWAGGDASGWMVFRDCDYYHYAPQKDEILSGSVSGADFATADSDLYNWGTGIECNGDDGNIEYVSITDSEIYNIADPTNQNGDATEGVGIRFGQYVDSGLAARNYIHDTEGSAISIFQSDDMTIRYNVIENAGSPHPDRDVKKSAIRVLSAPADSQVDVHNNTVVGGVIGFYGTTTNDSAIVNVYNNIFDAGNTLSPEHVMSTSMSGMIVDNFNLHYGFPGYENTIPGPSTIEADPAFRSISECPYFPDFASPALDAAFMDASSPGPNAEDYMGNVLTDNGGVLKSVYGASLDIGACEYSIYGNDTVYECFADVPSVCGSPWDAYANATAVDDSGGMYTDWISVAAGSRILVQMYGEATLNATLTADVDDFPGGEQDTEQSWMFTGQDIFHWTGEAPTNMRMRLRIDGIDMDSGDTAKLLLGTKPVVVE